ncbi:hypothetical protein [Virgibacillus halodenitrificans]|uniref:hypothetical protein n=1 Tax=Virgibacillus halodenitrificans TaxID=1482 RepID=UPI00045CF356|nr:hypothetical protein [Virgibacillus halodenitrificans]CDQ37693.1 hypothetical protein BN993_07255 [Virgibacillus halodenitrificans]
MVEEKNELITLIITIPLATKVISREKIFVEDLYASNVYLDLMEAILEKIKNDLVMAKKNLHSFHKTIVQNPYKNDIKSYKVMTGQQYKVLYFTSNQLKQLTTNTILQYLYDEKIQPLKKRERKWKMINALPPDLDLG